MVQGCAGMRISQSYRSSRIGFRSRTEVADFAVSPSNFNRLACSEFGSIWIVQFLGRSHFWTGLRFLFFMDGISSTMGSPTRLSVGFELGASMQMDGARGWWHASWIDWICMEIEFWLDEPQGLSVLHVMWIGIGLILDWKQHWTSIGFNQHYERIVQCFLKPWSFGCWLDE